VLLLIRTPAAATLAASPTTPTVIGVRTSLGHRQEKLTPVRELDHDVVFLSGCQVDLDAAHVTPVPGLDRISDRDVLPDLRCAGPTAAMSGGDHSLESRELARPPPYVSGGPTCANAMRA
jgi:hypothetical protein